MSNKNDKITLINFILDELNITYFRKLLVDMLLNKLSHRNLSDFAVSILKNK